MKKLLWLSLVFWGCGGEEVEYFIGEDCPVYYEEMDSLDDVYISLQYFHFLKGVDCVFGRKAYAERRITCSAGDWYEIASVYDTEEGVSLFTAYSRDKALTCREDEHGRLRITGVFNLCGSDQTWGWQREPC